MVEPPTLERAYRLRCYPTRRQRAVLGRLYGAARFVWNWALWRRSDAYRADKSQLNWIALSGEFTALKHAPETAWLADLPREPFNQVLRDQERAFANFFARRAKSPRFRRRGGKASVRFTLDQRREQLTRGREGERWAYVQLPGLGRVKLRRTEALLGRLRAVTLARDGAGRYFAAITADGVPLAEGLRILAGSSPATGERPESHARGVVRAAEAAQRATVVAFQRRPTMNREPARRPLPAATPTRAATRRAPSGTARRRVRAGL